MASCVMRPMTHSSGMGVPLTRASRTWTAFSGVIGPRVIRSPPGWITSIIGSCSHMPMQPVGTISTAAWTASWWRPRHQKQGGRRRLNHKYPSPPVSGLWRGSHPMASPPGYAAPGFSRKTAESPLGLLPGCRKRGWRWPGAQRKSPPNGARQCFHRVGMTRTCCGRQ